jgi:hypothetical protein
MGLHIVENNMDKSEVVARPKTRAEKELDIQNARLAAALRKAELRLAIEASTARILSLALTRGPVDADPEVA